MSDALAELLEGIARAPEAIRKATAEVEFERDPQTPGRTAYRITGASAAVVQSAIDGRMRHAEQHGGCAEFNFPVRKWGRYEALGYTLIRGE